MSVPRAGVFSFGRITSQRCPNKLLRPFGDTTLTDIMLEKLRAFGDQAFFAGYEDEFRRKCEQHGVRFVGRSAHSVSIDEPITEILSFLRDEDFTHFLIVNACLPFLRLNTVERFLGECVDGGLHPAFAVVRRVNHFVGLDGQPLNFPSDMRTINTKTVKPVLEFGHALYFFSKDYFFRHGAYWDWRSVRMIEMHDRVEMVDIDTEEDFAFAEALWHGLRRNVVEMH